MKIRHLRLNLLYYFLIYYSLMIFSIWNINHSFFSNNYYLIYDISNYILIGVFLLNIDTVFVKKKLRLIFPFLLIYLILLHNSKNIMYGQRAREIMFGDFFYFLIYLMSFSLFSKDKIVNLLKALLILFFVYNFLGIMGMVFKFEHFFFNIPNYLTDNYRYSSILKNPNGLGEVAFISLSFSLYLLLSSKSLKEKIIYLISFIIAILSLLISMSRSALLMTMIFIIIYFLFYFNKAPTKIKKIVIISIMIIFGATLIAVIINHELILSFFRLDQGLNEREELWRFALNYIKDDPFRGVGYGNSHLMFVLYGGFSVGHAHNLYLALLFELGIISTVLIVGYFLYFIFRSYYLYKFSNNYQRELFFIGTFLISFLIGQIFEFSFFKMGTFNYLLFSMFGVSMALFKNVKEEGIYKKKVVHLITGLKSGGAETMLYKVMKYRSGNFRYKVISLTDLGFYGEEIKEMGVKVVTLKMNDKKKVLFSPFILIYHLINIDVLQTWLYHANFIGTIFGVLTLSPKIIWGVRQSDYSKEHNSKSAYLTAKYAKYLSFIPIFILANSDLVREEHIKLGYFKKRFVTIYNGFEIEEYYYDKEARLKYQKEFKIKDEVVFINVARYDIQKDHKTLFEALKILKESYYITNFKIILVGADMIKENEELMELISSNNLLENALLLGVRSDVKKLLSVGDYFLLSSLAEGFPNVLGEAMLTNLITLSTDVGDAKTIIGSSGFTVLKENASLYSKRIYDMISLPSKEKKLLKEESRKQIVTNFDIKKIVKEYEALY